jgi:hypothetical protein
MNENDQIRNMLSKVRALTEGVIGNDSGVDVRQVSLDSGGNQDKSGERVNFDGINTIGFIKTQNQISDQVKTALISAIGEFIKGTGLLLDTIAITIEDSRVFMTTETIKNPGVDSIRSITFDTEQDDPQMNVISGMVPLNSDIVNLLLTITKTYSDPQIGRDNLIAVTQNQVQ